MINKSNLYNTVKKILKEIRFGNLSSRLSEKVFPKDVGFVNDFNNMLDALADREKMIKEYQSIVISNNELLKSLFNMLNEGAMSVSEDLKIVTVNDTQAKWFRKNKKKLLGENLLDILKNYNISEFESGEKFVITKDSFVNDKKNYKLNFELKNIKMTFLISIKQFYDNKSNLNYFIVSKDITTDVKMQKQKDTFIATLTHDLKVPILAEAKVLNLLSSETFGKNTEFQKEAFSNMISNNADMLALVTTLLDVYKIEDGNFEIKPSECSVSEIINNEINKLKYVLDGNSLTVNVQNKIEDSTIFADFDGISRVIKNILTNAINFAPQNSRIDICIFKDTRFLNIAISDSGKGIPKENLPYIFDRYFTTDKKYRKVGTGLGLFLSKKIVQLHGGEIIAESEPNKCTTFTVKLPLSNNCFDKK